MDDWNRQIIEEFRANGGKVGGMFAGAPMVLLHTTGARSGAERINPLMALEEDGHLYVFASKGGHHFHPHWYRNLIKHPAVTVEYGTTTVKATAKELTGAERDRVYKIQAEKYPQFAEYQSKTTRVIPVIELVREE